MDELINTVIAIVFASGDPISVERIAEVLEKPVEDIENALAAVSDQLAAGRRSVRLSRMNNRYQFTLAPEYAPIVRQALEMRKPPALSSAALEALAIVAYREPVTRGFVEKIRGVDSTYTITLLCDRGLITECGRLDAPGRPILYKTTPDALRTLGISSLDELPPLPETTDLPAGETSVHAVLEDGDNPAPTGQDTC